MAFFGLFRSKQARLKATRDAHRLRAEAKRRALEDLRQLAHDIRLDKREVTSSVRAYLSAEQLAKEIAKLYSLPLYVAGDLVTRSGVLSVRRSRDRRIAAAMDQAEREERRRERDERRERDRREREARDRPLPGTSHTRSAAPTSSAGNGDWERLAQLNRVGSAQDMRRLFERAGVELPQGNPSPRLLRAVQLLHQRNPSALEESREFHGSIDPTLDGKAVLGTVEEITYKPPQGSQRQGLYSHEFGDVGLPVKVPDEHPTLVADPRTGKVQLVGGQEHFSPRLGILA